MSTTNPAAAGAETSARKDTYTTFSVYQIDPAWRRLPDTDRAAARQEFASLLTSAEADGVQTRGVYSTVGLRHDVDLILWNVSDTVEAQQRLARAINASTLGAYLTSRNVLLGVALGSRYTSDHAPAFIKGIPPKRFLSVYPFIKSHDWYQLPFEQRRQTMAEHGRMGRDYPDILTNTVSCFGINDFEFIVAFEGDDVAEMVRMVEHLRPAASRPYPTLDTPIYLGVLKHVEEALLDLG